MNNTTSVVDIIIAVLVSMMLFSIVNIKFSEPKSLGIQERCSYAIEFSSDTSKIIRKHPECAKIYWEKK